MGHMDLLIVLRKFKQKQRHNFYLKGQRVCVWGSMSTITCVIQFSMVIIFRNGTNL